MLITQAIQEDGKESFKIEEVDVAYSKKELKLLEGVYISWFNTLFPNGYNIVNIINGIEKKSKETKEKIRIARNKPENLKQSSKQGKSNRGLSRGMSKYCGSSIIGNKFVSQIRFNNKTIHLGYYNNEIDSAKAYDLKALELFGLDCVLNFPELRNDYINGKIIINKSSYENNSKSGIKGIYFDKRNNRFFVNYLDKILNKKRSKYFKIKEKAIEFKKEMEK